MQFKRHGMTIGIERINKRFFISIKVIGKLTHEDYATITPLIDRSLEAVEEPLADVLLDATELEGWELRALWDDFRLGLKHGSQFNKIAIVGNKRWQDMAARLGSWFVSGEVDYFEDFDAALAWLDNPG